jgi:hypothetical protein
LADHALIPAVTAIGRLKQDLTGPLIAYKKYITKNTLYSRYFIPLFI